MRETFKDFTVNVKKSIDREYDGEPARPANDISEEDVTETVEDADTEEE